MNTDAGSMYSGNEIKGLNVDFGVYATSTQNALNNAGNGVSNDVYSGNSPMQSMQGPYAYKNGGNINTNTPMNMPSLLPQQQQPWSLGNALSYPETQHQLLNPAAPNNNPLDVPNLAAPPSSGVLKQGSLFELVNGQGDESQYQSHNEQLVNLGEGMKMYPDSGINNALQLAAQSGGAVGGGVMYSPMHSPYVANGCSPAFPQSCTQRTEPSKDGRDETHAPYQAPFFAPENNNYHQPV